MIDVQRPYVAVTVTLSLPDGTSLTTTGRAREDDVTVTLDTRDSPDDASSPWGPARRTIGMSWTVEDFLDVRQERTDPTPTPEELDVPDPTPSGPRPISATDRRALDALRAACRVARGPVAATALAPAFPGVPTRSIGGMLRRLVDAGHAVQAEEPTGPDRRALYAPAEPFWAAS